jgi:predicted nucleotidyltransferase
MTDSIPADLPTMLQVTPQQWQIIQRILQHYLPGYTVWAFGSRVGGPCKTFSDLDVAIVSAQPLSLQVLAEVAEAFSESDLPWKVDLIDWATTSEMFRQRILARKLVLQ